MPTAALTRLFSANAGADEERSFVLSDIEAAFRAEGWSFDKKEMRPGAPCYMLDCDGLKFGVLSYDVEAGRARSLQLRAFFRDQRSRLDKLNACNMANFKGRWVKAYVDGDDDLVLEMDLLALGAIKGQQVAHAITTVWLPAAALSMALGAAAD